MTNNPILFNSNTAIGTYGGRAIANLDSQAMLFGRIQFKNNSVTAGNPGGAMALYGTSRVALNPLSTVDFLDNHALLDGGAIYFEDLFATRLNCYVTVSLVFTHRHSLPDNLYTFILLSTLRTFDSSRVRDRT